MPTTLVESSAAAARASGSDFFDATDDLCPATDCNWMTGDRIGRVDDHHVSASASLYVLPMLAPPRDETVQIARAAAPQ